MINVTDALLIQLCADLCLYNRRFVKKLPLRVHRCPLERGERLRDKERGACRNLAFSVSLIFRNLIVTLCDLFRQMRNSFDIILGLGRKAQHEIQFYFIPAALKRFSGSVENDFLGQTFINNIPHPLASRLRCEGQAALFDILYLAHNIEGKCVDSKRRKGNIDTFFRAAVDQIVDKLRKMAVITRAQRTQRNLIVAGIAQHMGRKFF